MGKSETTLSIENTLRKNGITVSSSNHDYFGSTSDLTQEFADYVAAQYSTLKTDVILYGYSRGGVEVMKVRRGQSTRPPYFFDSNFEDFKNKLKRDFTEGNGL